MACRLSIFAALGMMSYWNFVKNSPALGVAVQKQANPCHPIHDLSM
jgi:hypothetical protein